MVGGAAGGGAHAARHDGNDASRRHEAHGAKYEPLYLALETELDRQAARELVRPPALLRPPALCPHPKPRDELYLRF